MKFFQSKFFWGLLALAAAAAITFLGIPFLNGQTREVMTVVRVKEPVTAETQITEDMLTTVEIGAYNAPEDAFTSISSVAGLYASVDLVPSDNLVPGKFTSTLARANESFYNLPSYGKVVVSVPLSSLSASVSGKIQPDDIVTIYGIVRDKNEDAYSVKEYPELRYMRVAAVTNSSAVDTDTVDLSDTTTSKTDVVPATVTLYALDFQARRLIEIQSNGTVYIALVGRGKAANDLYDSFIPIDPYAVIMVPDILLPDKPSADSLPPIAE